MDYPLLVIFTGVPGSGKTYFATRLAERLGVVRLNSDAMRLAIFGSVEKMDELYHSPQKDILNSYTFGALDYVTKALLEGGSSVVFEAIQRTRADRRHMEQLADACGAKLVLVAMEIDEEVAVRRVQDRDAASDVRKFSEQKAHEVVRHFRESTEPFERTDYIVHIHGNIPFDAQYAQFIQHLEGGGHE